MAGRSQEAAPLVRDALTLFRQKGNLAATAQAEALLGRIEAGMPVF